MKNKTKSVKPTTTKTLREEIRKFLEVRRTKHFLGRNNIVVEHGDGKEKSALFFIRGKLFKAVNSYRTAKEISLAQSVKFYRREFYRMPDANYGEQHPMWLSHIARQLH